VKIQGLENFQDIVAFCIHVVQCIEQETLKGHTDTTAVQGGANDEFLKMQGLYFEQKKRILKTGYYLLIYVKILKHFVDQAKTQQRKVGLQI